MRQNIGDELTIQDVYSCPNWKRLDLCSSPSAELLRPSCNSEDLSVTNNQKWFGILVIIHFDSEAELKKIVFHHDH